MILLSPVFVGNLENLREVDLRLEGPLCDKQPGGCNPILGDISQFDLRICFKWVGEKPPTRQPVKVGRFQSYCFKWFSGFPSFWWDLPFLPKTPTKQAPTSLSRVITPFIAFMYPIYPFIFGHLTG